MIPIHPFINIFRQLAQRLLDAFGKFFGPLPLLLSQFPIRFLRLFLRSLFFFFILFLLLFEYPPLCHTHTSRLKLIDPSSTPSVPPLDPGIPVDRTARFADYEISLFGGEAEEPAEVAFVGWSGVLHSKMCGLLLLDWNWFNEKRWSDKNWSRAGAMTRKAMRRLIKQR